LISSRWLFLKKWKPCKEALEKCQTPTDEQKNAFVVAWLLIEMRAKDLKEQVAKLVSSL
jgi:hypothetical protein